MKIIYIAKHRPDDWDEGAGISYVLESMGHEVVRIPEASLSSGLTLGLPHGDMLLAHHPNNFDPIHHSQTRPKCFWYFDLVDFPGDPIIADRCARRVQWHQEAINVFDLGFMNDGDWVQRDRTGKLYVMKEGADERYIGRGTVEGRPGGIAFVGSPRGGVKRMSCIQDLIDRYPDRFFVSGAREYERVYQRQLADVLTNVEVTVCPDGPVTDWYWSNRVYLMTAFGKFCVHPYCAELAKEFVDGVEIMFYRNRKQMFEIIDWALAHPAERETIAAAGMEATRQRHTYRNRLERMLRIVQAWKAMQETP
jgi:hypothetical protein